MGEVNMIKEDGSVIHFNNPKVPASQATAKTNRSRRCCREFSTSLVPTHSPISSDWPRRCRALDSTLTMLPMTTTKCQILLKISTKLPRMRAPQTKFLKSTTRSEVWKPNQLYSALHGYIHYNLIQCITDINQQFVLSTY